MGYGGESFVLSGKQPLPEGPGGIVSLEDDFPETAGLRTRGAYVFSSFLTLTAYVASRPARKTLGVFVQVFLDTVRATRVGYHVVGDVSLFSAPTFTTEYASVAILASSTFAASVTERGWCVSFSTFGDVILTTLEIKKDVLGLFHLRFHASEVTEVTLHDPLLVTLTPPLPASMWDLLHIGSLSVDDLVARRTCPPYEAFRRQFFGLLVHPLLAMTSVTIGRSAGHMT
jgi:hypothetical protein